MRAAERTFTLSSTVTTYSQKTWLIKVLIFYVQNDLKLVDSLIPKIFPGGLYSWAPIKRGRATEERGKGWGDGRPCMLPMAVAWSLFGDVSIRHELKVSCMTSHFP